MLHHPATDPISECAAILLLTFKTCYCNINISCFVCNIKSRNSMHLYRALSLHIHQCIVTCTNTGLPAGYAVTTGPSLSHRVSVTFLVAGVHGCSVWICLGHVWLTVIPYSNDNETLIDAWFYYYSKICTHCRPYMSSRYTFIASKDMTFWQLIIEEHL